MVTMTTTQELGQTPGRARCLAAARSTTASRAARGSWRHQTFAPAFTATATATGVVAGVTDAYLGKPKAGGKGLMSINRITRQLGTRTT